MAPRSVLALLPLLVGCTASQPADAPRPEGDEVLLGQTDVSFYADQGSIAVGDPSAPGHLRVRVSGRPMTIRALRVIYADGAEHAVRVELPFDEPRYSPVISLPNPPRPLQRVDLYYRSDAPPETRATVQVFGS